MPPEFSDGQKAAGRLLDGPQRYSCLVGGARAGKTFLIVKAILERATKAKGSRHAMLRYHANAARASLGGETLPKVRDLCFKHVHLTPHKSEGTWDLTNGSQITIGGLDEVCRAEKLLGLEYASLFLNEASQIPYESALLAFTRVAQKVPDLQQRIYVDLNPTSITHWTNRMFGEKRDPLSLQPLARPENYARAFLNPADNAGNLTDAYLESLASLPERQRRRFYEGVYVDDTDDALWSYELIEKNRCEIDMIPVSFRKTVVVGVDPSGASGRDDEAADEIGIVVVALGGDDDAYILADRSCRDRPDVWARRVATAFHEFSADHVVVEQNFGGDMVRGTIHAVDRNVPVRAVTASRGKAVRAEPISARYAQGRVHHVGRLPKLEDQLCAFTAGGYRGFGSPDHADAAIWAMTDLFEMVDGGDTGVIEFMRSMAEPASPP